jgi:hypothetical protein
MADETFSPHGTPPPKSGFSKALLWILSILAICLLLCCGGAGILMWRFGDAAKDFMANMATSDPNEIRQQTKEMVDIEIPDNYTPIQGMNMVAFQMVMYQTDQSPDGSPGMLMLMGMSMPGANAEEQEQQLRQSMQQQRGNQNFKARKTETREIEIKGEKVPFEFSEGTSAEQAGQDKTIHMVSGVFRGNENRPVMLQLTLPDDQYDEDAVMEMLQSIK